MPSDGVGDRELQPGGSGPWTDSDGRDAEGEQVLEQRAHLTAAAETFALVGSTEWHLDSDKHVWSQGMWALLGLEPGATSMDQASFLARVHPDDVGGLESAYARALSDRSTATIDFRILHPDGAYVEIHCIGIVELAADGRPERLVTTCRDVTAERGAARLLESQAAILANIREAIAVTDLGGRITYWGNGAATMFGYRADEMTGQDLQAIYPGAARGMLENLAQMDKGLTTHSEVMGLRRDGTEVMLDVRWAVLWSAEGEPAGYISVAIDATERRAAQSLFDRLWAAIEQSSESVVITDAQARIEYVNPAFERLTRYTREELLGLNPRILKSGAHPAAFYRAMWSALCAGRTWTGDMQNRRKDGSIFDEQATISQIRDESGSVSGYVAVKRDVTAERRLEAEATLRAREHALIMETISSFEGDVAPEISAQAVGRQLSRFSGVLTAGLFVFGPDGCAWPFGFTVAGESGDGYGPVPRPRSATLLRRARRGPWIADWTDRPRHPYNPVFMGTGVAAIAYAPVRHAGGVIGFLQISSGGVDARDRLAVHLAALVEVADLISTLLGARLIALNTSEAARRAISSLIEGIAFEPVFQPIFDIDSHEIVGYEGLTRFRDHVRPDLRFAEAERAGMGQQLELVTLKAALAAARDLPDSMWLDLNVSPGLVMESAELARLLKDVDRPIVLEVTEHEEIEDYVSFRAAVARLGGDVRIAVDDAGSGYASLRHILELRPALVKLDRALIMGIESDRARRALVAGMRRFAGDTDIRLIAEGVETQPELDTLRELGIELAQGFLLGRPLPIGGAAALDDPA